MVELVVVPHKKERSKRAREGGVVVVVVVRDLCQRQRDDDEPGGILAMSTILQLDEKTRQLVAKSTKVATTTIPSQRVTCSIELVNDNSDDGINSSNSNGANGMIPPQSTTTTTTSIEASRPSTEETRRPSR
jgi:hypothetical protein